MQGHVFKLGSSWYYTVSIGRKADGRRDQRKKGGFAAKRDAQEALTLLLKQVQDGVPVAPSKQTVGQFLETWLPSVRHSLRPQTWEGYEFLARRYVIPNIGGLRLAELNHVRINTLYAELLQNGGRGGKPLSRKTVRNVHILLRRALNDAAIPANPASKASPPKPARRDLQVWDAVTLQAFLAKAKGHQDYLPWLLLAATGMRRSEVLGLQWADVDFARATVSVEQSKTAAGRRLVTLDPTTLAALREWRLARMGSTYVVGTEPLAPGAFTERFRKQVRAWGFPIIRLHDLRHTHASLLLKEGVHPKVVQERLGHSSIQVTLDIYSHVVEGLQETAATAVGGFLWDAVAT